MVQGAGVIRDKRKEPEPGEHDLVEVMPLGAGQEVGRSCVILKYMYVYLSI